MFFSCSYPSSGPPCERGFYVWKTRMHFDESLIGTLKSLNIVRLYVRFFDVQATGDEPRPVAPPLWEFGKVANDFEIVPVVYITQSAMLSGRQDSLARNIYRTVGAMLSRKFSEIQLDCDWTRRTRNAYFNLIRELKSLGVTVSVTLRLHQLKNFSVENVPPADKATLMCYHTSNPELYGDVNAILDVEELKKYVSKDTGYPIALDFALPIFSWGVRFRAKKFAGIVSGLTRKDVEKSGL
ncbi:MAG: hypothetical protein NZ534_12855, partial [Bacteroidia bacterium]|nr:hypothetical protein [Bacteroidia bacterium]